MGMYRKKPAVIEAVQFTDETKDRVYNWAAEKQNNVYHGWDEEDIRSPTAKPELRIPTLEGEMVASLGDWIICGIKGELYPCKPDVFEQTYEEVEDSSHD